ncbi:MAG: M16 family metallopeptidase, partial [Armatimonadota bacterium]
RARRRALGVDAGEEPEDSGLARVTPAQLEAFHRRCFRPERAVVAVHGRVDPKSVRDLVQALLGVGGWADLAPVPPMRVPPVEPVPSGIRDTVVPGNAGLGACALCWQVPGAEAGKETMARLLLLDAVVGQGKGARLFGLRERLGIAYEVRSALEPGFRLGSWSLTAMGRRGGIEYRDRLTEVVRAIADGSAPVAAEELARARGLLLGQREVAGAMGWSRARRTAAWEALGHGECDRELPTLLAAATSPQLAETARRILAGRPGVVRTA